MRQSPTLRVQLTLLAAGVLVFVPRLAFAANLFWDGTGTSWNVAGSWSTVNNATTPNPAAPPGSADQATFNITTVNTAQTVDLDADHSVLGLTFNSTGTVLIESGSGPNTLTPGLNGISVAGTAGAVTISAAVSSGNMAQVWTNNSANTLTISGNVSNGVNLLTVVGSGNTTISGVLGGGGSGGLMKNGAGTLTLSNIDTLTGAVTVMNGTLQLSSLGALTAPGSTSIAATSGNIGALTLTGASSSITQPVKLARPPFCEQPGTGGKRAAAQADGCLIASSPILISGVFL